MFNTLFALCKNLFHFNHMNTQIANILALVEQDYAQDHNLKNAMIDTISQVLLAHKVQAPAVIPPVDASSVTQVK